MFTEIDKSKDLRIKLETSVRKTKLGVNEGRRKVILS